MSKLERFTRDDWFGFAGASKLPDGTDPLIAHIDPWVIIVAGDERAINGSPCVSVTVHTELDTLHVRSARREFNSAAPAEKYANFLADNVEMIEALETLEQVQGP